jgi:hypothetical protein
MIETGIIVVISVGIASVCTLLGYSIKICFMSKCSSCSGWGIHIEREIKSESQNVSNMHLPTINLS